MEMDKKRKKGIKCAVFLLLMALYILFVKNYMTFQICKVRGGFFLLSIIWIFVIFILTQELQFENKKVIKYWNLVLLIFLPFLSVIFIEIMCNPYIKDLQFQYIILNYILLLAIQMPFVTLFGLKNGLYVSAAIAFLFGTVNFYVLKFKGVPLMPADFTAIKTAVQVSGHYDFSFTDAYISGFLLFIVEVCLIKLVKAGEPNKKEKGLFLKRCGIFIAELSACIGLYRFPYLQVLDISLNGWTLAENIYQYGSSFAFLLETQQLKPDLSGYSKDQAEELLYDFDLNDSTITNESAPNIIVIMNESFCDLSVLGDINTDECLRFWKSADFKMRGYAYASQYGGGTCNTEFEFLTGSTMAFVPNGGIYPYQNYDLKNVENLAAVLGKHNYTTIAVHPANEGNWNREKVYQDFGFDRFLSIQHFENPAYYHGYVSDRAVYQNIIEEYENKKQPLFLFAVTMQNHGGYSLDTLHGAEAIKLKDPFSKYEKAVTYMTLLKESDTAFEELYHYFMQVDEPVLICMFGDHQPDLAGGFIDDLCSADLLESGSGKNMQRFVVPYIVFSNYDIGIDSVEKNTSVNYLGASLLALAGYQTPYFALIHEMERDIPIINAKGYVTGDQTWHSLDENNQFIDQYRLVQYYNLFEKHK